MVIDEKPTFSIGDLPGPRIEGKDTRARTPHLGPPVEPTRWLPPVAPDWLPEDPATEESLLGCILLEPRVVMPMVRRHIKVEDFSRAATRVVYAAMLALTDRGDDIDIRTLDSELRRADEMWGKTYGGPELLVGWMSATPTVVHAASYAKRIRFIGAARSFIRAMNGAMHVVLTDPADGDATKLIAKALAPFEKVVADRASGRAVTAEAAAHDYYATLTQRVDQDPAVVGIDVGFAGLDRYVAYRPGELTYIAGGPSAGKTAMLGTLAELLVTRSQPVPSLFVSIEQPLPQIMDRIVAGRTSIDSWRLARGRFEDTDRALAAIGQALEPVAKWPLHFLEHGSLTGAELDVQVQYHVARYGVKVVFVDYVQLLADNEEGDGTAERVKAASAKLRQIARRHNVAVVSASQVNKEDGLRWAQELMQDASVVLLLKRDIDKPDTTIHVRKNRNGMVGANVKARFNPETAHFVPVADMTMPRAGQNEIPF